MSTEGKETKITTRSKCDQVRYFMCLPLIFLDLVDKECSKRTNVTSKIGSPVRRLRAANSRIIVPAHAVQVSRLNPNLGEFTPYRRFICIK